MKIMMTMLVKNEIDIIKLNIDYHLLLIDHLFVMDNCSTDGTYEYLKTLSEKVTVLTIASDMYDQKLWVTRMVNYAINLGADWVINLDADEFLVGNIRKVIEDAHIAGYNQIYPKGLMFRSTINDDVQIKNPIERMTHRDTYSAKYDYDKVIFNVSNFSMMVQGNHWVTLFTGVNANILRTTDLKIFHYSDRNCDQFKRKYTVQCDSSRVTQMGHIWKQRNDIFISQGEQGLEEFYQKEILFAVDNLERDSTLVRLMKNYSDEELFNDPILQELNQLALSYSNVEGNLLYEHPLKSMSDSFNVAFYEKRYNLFQLAKSRTKILEIGFNAGHSLLLMLTANPDIESLSFDLNFHAYTRPCFDFLKRYFPKIDIRFGDSREEVANYCNENPKKFDMIHVDGSHDVNFAAIDYENVKKLATQDTIVVFDDASRGSPLYDFLQLKFACNEIRSVDRDELGLKSTSLHEIFTFIR